MAAFLTSKKVAVTLTHSENEEVALLQRTQRSSKGALLLSLHHDSVQPQFLSRQSITRGYCSKKANGFSIFVSRKNPCFETSLRYATALGTALRNKGFVPTLHHAEPIAGENRELLIADKGIYVFDELIVLKTATSPALLLEAAVIVNPDDDALASSDKFRLAVAESVYEMLEILR